MIIKVNSLVLYKNKGAVVADIANDKYTIKTANGERKSVRLKDIEFLHAGPCSVIPQPTTHPEAELLAESVELMGEDLMSFADFTELVYGADTPANALAAAELLTMNIYFKGSVAGGVQANSAEHISSILEKERQKQVRKI